ncbi:hypothetical protein [Microbulbifer sp. YPW16]|uniref:hypothetical protein n=1 Tax=Microbulbifer sp. YPW16 TaxID=2904242 RepID=UPI001E523717|nr:hypothetical protein [Microbulbifer sp. YPW16]UHQ55870.1 hypothetical protein LVE68_02450 [Microbulbifer sp. YPW16]
MNQKKRKVIVHYHFFKNAGSSIDEILQSSFGERWSKFDKSPAGNKILPDELSSFLISRPDLRAVSSHQAVPPLPAGNYEIFPIFFLRHPIIRARSAYLFEWQKQKGLSVPKGSFSEYVEEKLDPGNGGVIADFHVYQLANKVRSGRWPVRDLDPVKRFNDAKCFLESLPFFGLVEHFQESLERMHFYLKYHFPELRVVNYEVNATDKSNLSLREKLARIRDELGDRLYTSLIDHNQLDLAFYEFALERFQFVKTK